jgi:hypothetical protein
MHMKHQHIPTNLMRILSTIFLVLWSFTSCGSMGTSTDIHPKELYLAIDQFHNAVMWEAYDKALIFVSPSLADDFSRLGDRLAGKIRVTEFDVRRPQFDPKTKCGWITVNFKLYRRSNPQLETKTVREKWCPADKGDLWQIVQHDFKEVMN